MVRLYLKNTFIEVRTSHPRLVVIALPACAPRLVSDQEGLHAGP